MKLTAGRHATRTGPLNPKSGVTVSEELPEAAGARGSVPGATAIVKGVCTLRMSGASGVLVNGADAAKVAATTHDPGGSAGRVADACPFASSVTVATGDPFAAKVILPAGLEEEVMTAVTVTGSPAATGLAETVREPMTGLGMMVKVWLVGKLSEGKFAGSPR